MNFSKAKSIIAIIAMLLFISLSSHSTDMVHSGLFSSLAVVAGLLSIKAMSEESQTTNE